MKQYTVLQQHFGDKQYWPGDSREVHDADAAELLAMGLIGENGGEKSQQSAPKNKQPVAQPSEDSPGGEDDHA